MDMHMHIYTCIYIYYVCIFIFTCNYIYCTNIHKVKTANETKNKAIHSKYFLFNLAFKIISYVAINQNSIQIL